MYSLLTYLLADNWLIFRLCAQCMISNSEFVIIFIKTMYIKKIITSRFCFRDILNNQGPSSLSLQLGWYHFSWTWLLRISQKPHGNPVLFMVECFMRQPFIYEHCFNVGFYSSTLPDATFSLFNLSVSDIIDKDMEKYQRKWAKGIILFEIIKNSYTSFI